MDMPGLTQFKQKGQFVTQTAWVSWCNSYASWLLCQWFSVQLSPCQLYFFFLIFFRLTFYLYVLVQECQTYSPRAKTGSLRG